MKIIFLDIDGVLNHHIFYKKRYDEKQHEKTIKKENDKLTKESEVDFYAGMIDPESVIILNELIEETGAKIVISSTWRLGKDIETLQMILDKHGFIGEIIDKTPRGCGCCKRGNEIYEWISANTKILGAASYEFKSYVILDDDSDMLLWQREHFINIDQHVGITPTNVYKAKRILNGE
jgi:hypothetical protein